MESTARIKTKEGDGAGTHSEALCLVTVHASNSVFSSLENSKTNGQKNKRSDHPSSEGTPEKHGNHKVVGRYVLGTAVNLPCIPWTVIFLGRLANPPTSAGDQPAVLGLAQLDKGSEGCERGVDSREHCWSPVHGESYSDVNLLDLLTQDKKLQVDIRHEIGWEWSVAGPRACCNVLSVQDNFV
ncbi:hypothetical protein P7K49_004430 [Saguinus oedipus]|uniref:Uncharacterized protein n=1 Tax=Saguinus oedipus TaxID=9490 RepID=A0ABQ9W7C5_SAGOE|nr:hypothetical protein P7K49_004430 [Saguinus oedipus]